MRRAEEESYEDLAYSHFDFDSEVDESFLDSLALEAWQDRLLTLPIEAVPLGVRIGTKNPRDWEVQPSVGLDGEAWYEVHASVVRTDGNRVEVELLRPESWVREEGLEVGGEIRLRLAEMNVDGVALITKLDRREDIEASDIDAGNLVTGRFKTLGAMNVVKAVFSDGTEIVGTDIHPFWSVDREDWIALGELQEYERVQTRSGPIYLLSLQRALPADVFNIEVDCHHVYEIGEAGVLVHNSCAGMHHHLPRFLGSKTPYKHSSLTPLNKAEHTALHNALNSHLRTKISSVTGKSMAHARGRSGLSIQNEFSKFERLKAVTEFFRSYKGGQHLNEFRNEVKIAIQNGWW